MRRLCNQCGSQFPPIKAEDFRVDFEAWKTTMEETVPFNVNSLQNFDSSPSASQSAPYNQSITSMDNEVSLLNVACTDFSDFDTQMSPLIYSDSENEDDEASKKSNSQFEDSQCDMTPEIACNQEHAAITRARAKEIIPIQSKSHMTPIKRNLRSNNERKSPACKRLNYKQLPIRVNSNNAKANLKLRTCLLRKKKHPLTNSTMFYSGDSERFDIPSTSSRQRSTSSTSDVQIMTQNILSPIIISTSEDERTEERNFLENNVAETQFNSEMSCPSPDLFTSFTSIKSDALSQNIALSQKILNTQNEEKQPEVKETDPFREIFGAPDECDDIDLLSNTNVDIFEITKNSVFDNVLCSADDKITPLKKNNSHKVSTTPSMSSLSGLRVVLPRLNGNQVEKIQNELITQSQSQPELPPVFSTSTDVIDLTANDTQKIIEVNSSDSAREKTPERKQELTPSTRSCLKRHADDRKHSDEKRKKSPYTRLGWLSKTSPKCGTPQSHRSLEKWRRRTNDNNLSASEVARITKPRNLFMEFKSKDNKKTRNNVPSTSTALSPTVFSDHE